MQQNVSVKLLNKASQDSNGRLELYSELTHSFQVGQSIWISGGRYDNTDLSSFITTNPYTQRYKIVAIDPSINKFTLNLVIIGTLYFPYSAKGATSNQYGNPQDSVDPGYNFYSFGGLTSIGLGVYASTTAFVRGKYKSGQVFNGILGTDKNILAMNDTLYSVSSIPKIIIQHAVFKHVKLPAGLIQNKSFGSGIACLKYKAVENIGAGFPLVSVPIGLSADNYGWSSFDKAVLGDNLSLTNKFITIEGTWVTNPNLDTTNQPNIQIYQPTIKNCRIGDFVPLQINSLGGTYMRSPIIESGDIRNFFNRSNFKYDQKGGELRQRFQPVVTSVAYNGPAGEFRIGVTYDSIANQIFSPGQNYFIHGVLDANNNMLKEISAECTIISATYTFGNQGAIKSLVISVPSLVPSWISFTTFYGNPNSFKWNDFVMYNLDTTPARSMIQTATLENITSLECYLHSNTNLSTNLFIKNLAIPINISRSVFERVNLEGIIQFNVGNSINNKLGWVSLINCPQYTDFGSSNSIWNAVYIKNDTLRLIYQADFRDCYMIDASITNSQIVNTYVGNISVQVMLYNCDVIGTSFIADSPNIYWELCSFNPTLSFYNAPNLVVGGSFKGRKTRFVTGTGSFDSNGQLLVGTKVFNVNNKKVGTPSINPPVSTEAVVQVNVPPAYTFSSKIIPVFRTQLNPSGSSIFYAMYDLGDKIQSGPFWPGNKSRNRLIFGDLLSNPTLTTIQNNVDTNTTSGIYDNSGGLVNPPIITATASGLDTNFIYNIDPSYKKTKTATNVDVVASAFELEPVAAIPAGYPQRTGPNPHVNIDMLINDGINPFILLNPWQTPTSSPFAINIVPVFGTWKIQFKHTAYQNIISNPATLIPHSFFEVEDILYEVQLAGGSTSFSGLYTRANCISSGPGVDSSNQPYSAFPSITPNIRVDKTGAEITFPTFTGRRTIITVNFWITSYISGNYTNCGMKTKQTYVWVMET